MPKAPPPEWPRLITFGVGRVRISKRSNGHFVLAWREAGSLRQTTKTTEAKALDFATAKARHLDAATGARWQSQADAQSLTKLKEIAGDQDGAVWRLLQDLADARKILKDEASLTKAAGWYAAHGPMKIERVTVGELIRKFLGEYKEGSETLRTFKTEFQAFLNGSPGRDTMLLVDLQEPLLKAWTSRKVRGNENPSARTHDNRITNWITLLNRGRDWKFLPDGKHAADLLRRPVVPDAGKEIFTVDQGRKLIGAVLQRERKLLGYLLIAGWLGLRPSEVQRLCWNGFEWDRGYLHVSAEVAGKTSQERYIPVDPRLLEILHALYQAAGSKPAIKTCGFRSREFLSVLARDSGVCDEWPTDVLRHSFCSYRIALTQSRAQVAEEAGNSEKMLKDHYRRPLRFEDGVEWWDLLSIIKG